MVPSTDWNAVAYHDVSRPHVVWGEKVLATIDLRGDERVIDAGCGTGRLTALLLDRLPKGRLVAVDRSSTMLTVAREYLAPRAGGRLTFVRADLLALPFHGHADVIFSTATFHWVLDHARLFEEAFGALVPGGRLVAQCGGDGNLARSHHHAMMIAGQPPFREYFVGWHDPWEFASPETTAARLASAGFAEIETALEAAPTRFSSAEAFSTFVTTVILRPHLARLPTEALGRQFVEAFTEQAGLDSPAFTLDYVRLNLRATRPGR